MEFLKVLDDDKNELSKKVERGKTLNEGEHILLAIMIIEDSNNKYLIQKTSKQKGDCYAFTGGHILYNETSREGIIREAKEELCIKVNKPTYITDIKLGIPFMDIYYLKRDIKKDKLKLQKEEVESIEFLSKEEILNLIKKGKLRQSHYKAFDKFLKLQKD